MACCSALHLGTGGGAGRWWLLGVALSVPLWSLERPEGIPNRSQHHHRKKSEKSPSETCENCSLHSSARTKCCCRLSSPLTLTFPLTFLSSYFLFSSFSPYCSLSPQHHLHPNPPSSFTFSVPDSLESAPVHTLTSPIKVVGSD